MFFPFTSVSGFVQVSTNQFSLFAAFASVLVATDRACEDAMHTSLPGSPTLSSNVGFPNGSGHDLDGMGTRSRSTTDTQIAPIPALTTWMSRMDSHITKTLGDFATRFAETEQNFSSPLHVCARSRHMLPQHQMYPVRQDPGLRSNKLTAPQPQGPMAQGHLTTTETHDEDLILPQAPKMDNLEVPFYYGSLANNTSKGLQSGSIPCGKNPKCKLATNLSEFIAR